MKVCIIGGGNLGHAYSGMLPADVDAMIITSAPQNWSHILSVYDENHNVIAIRPICPTSDKTVLSNADVIIVTVPCNVRCSMLPDLVPYINKDALLICAPTIGGTNFLFEQLFPENPYACLQRVPYICRTIEYGHSVFLSKKTLLEVFFSKNCNETHYNLFRHIHNIPFVCLQSFWPLVLSNSNPIIHMARICEIINSQYPTDAPVLFYEQWGDNASALSLAMDNELKMVMQTLNVSEYHDLLSHYGVSNAVELTKKFRTITSFRGIMTPMVNINGKYYIDTTSRYIQEDLIYGTCFIKQVAQHLGIKTPSIDYVISKMSPLLGWNLLHDNVLDTELFKQYLGYDIIDCI